MSWKCSKHYRRYNKIILYRLKLFIEKGKQNVHAATGIRTIDLSIKWQLTVHLLIRHNVINTYIVYLVYCITRQPHGRLRQQVSYWILSNRFYKAETSLAQRPSSLSKLNGNLSTQLTKTCHAKVFEAKIYGHRSFIIVNKGFGLKK